MSLTYILTSMQSMLELVTWRDYLECTLIIFACHRALTWLAQDKTKTLIPLVYFWCLLATSSYALQLDSLFILSLIGLPLMSICLVLFHEEKLQKNFIFHKTLSLPTIQQEWRSHLIKSLLHAMNKQQAALCFIEGKDSLHTIIQARCPINAPITSSIIDMLIESSKDVPVTLWLTQTGTIIGTGLELLHEQQAPHNAPTPWSEYAQLITTHNDTIIIFTHPETNTCSIIMQGNHLHQLSADHTLRILIKATTQTQGDAYAPSSFNREHTSPCS